MIRHLTLNLEELSYRTLFHQACGEISSYPQDAYRGHGIVICGGGERCFTNAWIHLHILRDQLHCTLPIEYWYFGDEELDVNMRALLEPLQVQCKDGAEFARDLPQGEGRGFALKALALWKSSFREVLFLDADNLPVKDPTFLFLDENYLRTGALFWSDIRRTDPKSLIWPILNLLPRADHEFETGQMVINKQLWWPPLVLALHLNRHFPFYYQHILGDKQTFQLAAWKLDYPYACVSRPPDLIEANRYQSMLNQFAPDGTLLFQHRTQADWNLFGNNPEIPGFQFEQEARSLLADLGSRWSGTVDRKEKNILVDEKILSFSKLKKAVWVQHTTRGCGRKLMELCPDGSVGSGAGWEGKTWRCEEQDGGPRLILSAGGLDVVQLCSDAAGAWRGRKAFAEAVEIEVIPIKKPIWETSRSRPSTPPWLGLFCCGKASRSDPETQAQKTAHSMEACEHEIRMSSQSIRYGEAKKWESIFWKYPQVANEAWGRFCLKSLQFSPSAKMRKSMLRCLLVLTAQRPDLVARVMPWENRPFWGDLIMVKKQDCRREELITRWFCALLGTSAVVPFQKVLADLILKQKNSRILQKTVQYLLSWDEPRFPSSFYPAFREMAQNHPDWRPLYHYLMLLRPEPMMRNFCPTPQPDQAEKYLLELKSRWEKNGSSEALAANFPIREAAKEIFTACDQAEARLLIVHNIQDGQGDEIIRLSNILHAFLHRFQHLEIHLFGRRRYLYDHARIIFHELAAREELKTLFQKPFAGLINFYEPWLEAKCSDPGFEKELMQCKAISSPPFELTASKDYNFFLYQSFKIGETEWIEDLGLDKRFAPNVYEASWRLLMELGLPLFTCPPAQPNSTAFTGIPHSKWAANWQTLTLPLRQNGVKAIALINPFGGQNARKGFSTLTFGYLLKTLQELTQEGYGLVIVTTGTSWGQPETLKPWLTLLPKTCRDRIVIDPETPHLSLNLPLNAADAAMQRRKYFAHFADIIFTVEGWLVHLAHALGKPYRVWMAPGSYPSTWQPLALANSPIHLRFSSETYRTRQVGNLNHLASQTTSFWPEKGRLFQALEALGDSHDLERKEIYLQYSFNDDRRLRASALRGLAPFRDRKTRGRLREALNDSEAKVRAAAARALLGKSTDCRRRGIGVSKTLWAYVLIGANDWPAVKRLGLDAGPALKACLNDAEGHIRLDATLILRHLGKKEK